MVSAMLPAMLSTKALALTTLITAAIAAVAAVRWRQQETAGVEEARASPNRMSGV